MRIKRRATDARSSRDFRHVKILVAIAQYETAKGSLQGAACLLCPCINKYFAHLILERPQSDITGQVSDNFFDYPITVLGQPLPGYPVQQVSHQHVSHERGRTSAAPGIILFVASLLEVLAMLHHPSVQTPDISQAVEQIAKFSTLSAVVHGVLITLMLLIAYGFVDFAVRRGLHRPLIRAGAIGYGCGVVAMIGAALVSGFIITDLASLMPHATAVDLQINRQLLLLCRVLNQSCANFAVVAMSAGIVWWSLDLCRDSGSRRAVGVFGCLVGLVPALALMFGEIRLDVHGMTAVVAAQAAWNIAVAVLMVHREPLGDLDETQV